MKSFRYTITVHYGDAQRELTPDDTTLRRAIREILERELITDEDPDVAPRSITVWSTKV